MTTSLLTNFVWAIEFIRKFSRLGGKNGQFQHDRAIKCYVGSKATLLSPLHRHQKMGTRTPLLHGMVLAATTLP
jgi:hypothetical protein